MTYGLTQRDVVIIAADGTLTPVPIPTRNEYGS